MSMNIYSVEQCSETRCKAAHTPLSDCRSDIKSLNVASVLCLEMSHQGLDQDDARGEEHINSLNDVGCDRNSLEREEANGHNPATLWHLQRQWWLHHLDFFFYLLLHYFCHRRLRYCFTVLHFHSIRCPHQDFHRCGLIRWLAPLRLGTYSKHIFDRGLRSTPILAYLRPYSAFSSCMVTDCSEARCITN